MLNADYTGTFAMIGYHFPLRFFHRLGATEVDPDSVCNKAGHVALEYLYGTSLEEFDPRGGKRACSILVWGANLSASAPHQHEHWLSKAAGTVIVVDPLRTETARPRADLHLRPRPGSDAALAFALMHVLWRDGLLDPEFIGSHTSGCEDLTGYRALLAGLGGRNGRGEARHRARRPLVWARPVAAVDRPGTPTPAHGRQHRAFGRAPASAHRQPRPCWQRLPLPERHETRGLDGDYLTGRQLAGDDPPMISQMDLARCLEDPATSRRCSAGTSTLPLRAPNSTDSARH